MFKDEKKMKLKKKWRRELHTKRRSNYNRRREKGNTSEEKKVLQTKRISSY